jgi:hypothetical protein
MVMVTNHRVSGPPEIKQAAAPSGTVRVDCDSAITAWLRMICETPLMDFPQQAPREAASGAFG